VTAPRLTGQTPNNDVYRIDRNPTSSTPHQYLQVIGLWDGMDTGLLAAARARRAADLTGTCPCCPYFQQGHDPSCPANTHNLLRRLDHWESRISKWERGMRITEDPTNTIGRVAFETVVGDRG
jgi:hypothetical protein